jgi:hypothetical protein
MKALDSVTTVQAVTRAFTSFFSVTTCKVGEIRWAVKNLVQWWILLSWATDWCSFDSYQNVRGVSSPFRTCKIHWDCLPTTSLEIAKQSRWAEERWTEWNGFRGPLGLERWADHFFGPTNSTFAEVHWSKSMKLRHNYIVARKYKWEIWVSTSTTPGMIY